MMRPEREDRDRLVLVNAGLVETLEDRLQGDRGKPEPVGDDRAVKVDIIAGAPCGFISRHPAP
jgi:hypothetical protein